MGHRLFDRPIYLRRDDGACFVAWSARDALEYLDQHWNAPRAAHYRRARKLCLNALDGWTTAEKAREAVIDAAGRAGLLARGVTEIRLKGRPRNSGPQDSGAGQPAQL